MSIEHVHYGMKIRKQLVALAMGLSAINKINNKLKCLYRKYRFLTILRRLPCNALMQPYFDHACSAWYLNLTKTLKNRMNTSYTKCICSCLQLDKITHISHKEFESLNLLPVTERFNQCIISRMLESLA